MVYGKWYPSRFGARVAAGGADYTGGVGAAGTVARIDLRVLHPSIQIKPPLLPTVRPLRSLPGSRPLSLRVNTLAIRRPPLMHATPPRPLPSAVFVPVTNSARASGRARCDGPPAREQEPRRGSEPW
jgi:hypothetical protein